MKKRLSLLLALWIFCGCTPVKQNQSVLQEEQPTTDVVQSIESIYTKDAAQLVELIEGTHPCFVLDDVPEGYAESKAAFLTEAASCKDNHTFQLAAMAYAASLRDGHTKIDSSSIMLSLYQLPWIYQDGKLWKTDDNGNRTDIEIFTIGGVTAEKLYACIDRYIVSENASGQTRSYSTYTKSRDILAKAGVTITQENNRNIIVIETSVGSEKVSVRPKEQQPYSPTPVVSCTWMTDVFYMDLNSCTPGVAVDAACEELAAAVEDGLSKVILDLRGNGGGNSSVGKQILRAMKMQGPNYGSTIRLSDLALETYPQYAGWKNEKGLVEIQPDLSMAKVNPNIDLVVLTDMETYSSAKMLAVWVQDGKLGSVIGQPSCNKPSSYGDILRFTLEGTGFTGTVSHKRFLRPDASANPEIMELDLIVPEDEDALEAALTLLQE